MKKILFLSFVFASLNLNAEVFKSGEYLMKEEATNTYSKIFITKNKTKTFYKIITNGKNSAHCELSGNIVNFKSKLIFDEETKESCSISIENDGDTISIFNNGNKQKDKFDISNCVSMFCDEGVSFEGEYKKIDKICESNRIESERNIFSNLFDKEKYEESIKHLKPILNNCELTFEDKLLFTNNLALTYYKLQESHDCKELYTPFMNLLKKTNEELKKEFGDSNYEDYIDYIRDSRYTYQLCNSEFKTSP